MSAGHKRRRAFRLAPRSRQAPSFTKRLSPLYNVTRIPARRAALCGAVHTLSI